jgi:AraC-like DNA-binding protein
MAKKAKQILEYRSYELDQAFPVLLLDGDNWRISQVPSNRLHFHNCLEIGLCHSDSGTLMMRDESHGFRAGDVTCIPRFVPHTTFSAKGASSLWSYIFVDLWKIIGETVDWSSKVNRDDSPKVHFFASCILDELRAKKANYRVVVKALLTALFHELRRPNAENAQSREISKEVLVIAPVLDHIESLYMNKVTVEELAAMCHLSATHFRRLFHAIMGVSPLAFLNKTRIDKACFLLQTTDKAILEIAEMVGFGSISSFNRCFSAIAGVPPREYRNPETRGSLRPSNRYILQYNGWMEPENPVDN